MITEHAINIFVTNTFASFIIVFIVLIVELWVMVQLKTANLRIAAWLSKFWEIASWGVMTSGICYVWLPASL